MLPVLSFRWNRPFFQRLYCSGLMWTASISIYFRPWLWVSWYISLFFCQFASLSRYLCLCAFLSLCLSVSLCLCLYVSLPLCLSITLSLRISFSGVKALHISVGSLLHDTWTDHAQPDAEKERKEELRAPRVIPNGPRRAEKCLLQRIVQTMERGGSSMNNVKTLVNTFYSGISLR